MNHSSVAATDAQSLITIGKVVMSAQSETGVTGMRELTVEEADIVSGARPFGDCNDHVVDFGLFYIKVISCPDGTSVSIGTPLFGGHSMPL